MCCIVNGKTREQHLQVVPASDKLEPPNKNVKFPDWILKI